MSGQDTGSALPGKRLHPGTMAIRFVKQVPEFVVGLPAFAALAADAGWGLVLLLALTGAGIALVVSVLTWLRFSYRVGERDIVIESGLLQRQRRVIPFDRIQDIDIEQRLLARLFGLAKVRIETGGAARDEGSLDAVSLAEAHQLRDLLRRSDTAAAEASAGTHDIEPVLFRMKIPRLLLAGLFNFSLIYLAVIGAAFQYFEPLFERYLERPELWELPSREKARGLGLYLTLSVLFLIVLLGIVTGLLRTIARDYRFRLSRTPTGLRRRRGLFTLSEVLIPIRRVQLAVVESGWLRERLGWYALDFQTLSSDPGQSGHQDAAPFARMEEIEPILAEAGIRSLPQDQAYTRVSWRMILRQSLSRLLPIGLALLVGSFFWPPALLLLLLLPVGAIGQVLAWRRHRYALAEGALYIREGLLRPRLWIMPFGKAQTVSIRRSLLQRKLGLATVEVDTAGALVLRYPAIRDVTSAEADVLAARLLEEYRTARRMVRRGDG